MTTPDDVNNQHLAAMGLAGVPLGQPYATTEAGPSKNNEGRCPEANDGFRCARPEGHDGRHARGSLTWGSEPSTGNTLSCDDAKAQVLHETHDYQVGEVTHRCPGLYDGVARNAVTKKPREWAEAKHLLVRDADGWRNAGQSWDDPISEAEFDDLIASSTVEQQPVGALGQPMHRHAYMWTGRSADTCSVTEGDQWCGQSESAEVHQLRVRSEAEAFEDTDLQKLGRVRSDVSTIKRLRKSTRCEAVMHRPETKESFWCTQDKDHEGLHTSGDQTWEWKWPEPTKTREGDQVLPTGDESIADDQALLIADIEARRQVGIERYGQGHRPFNGRNTLQDFYEEMIDGAVYARSLLRAREATRAELIDVVAKAFHPEPDGEDEANAMIAVDRILDWVVLQTQEGASGA